jgi:hypothetical protein
MSQFRKADSSVYTVFLDMIEKNFPELSGYSFGLLFREKIQKSQGNVTIASICQPTKLLSYFAKNDNGKPFDFLIIVDEMAWCCAKEKDRIRIIRHELRHIDMSGKSPRLIGHDFQDFYKEVDLNADDPSWCQKLAEVTLAGYDQVKDGQKDPRNDHRNNPEVSVVTKDPVRQTKLPVGKKEDLTKESKDTIIKAAVKSSMTYIGRDVDNKEVWVENEAGKPKIAPIVTNLDDLARSRGLLSVASS